VKAALVIPVFRAKLPEFSALLEQHCAEIECHGFELEVCLVFDSGTEQAFDALKALAMRPRTHVIYLPTNVGQQAATLAGLKSATADIYITLDEDQCVDAGEISKLLEPLTTSHVDLVIGIRPPAAGFVRKLGTRSMVWLGRLLFGSKAPPGWGSVRVIRHSVVAELPATWSGNRVLGFELFGKARNPSWIELPHRNFVSKSAYTNLGRFRYWKSSYGHYIWRWFSELYSRRASSQ
jgi:hypothetical protein